MISHWLLRRLLALWVRYTVRPEDTLASVQKRDHPVCYVLERRDVTDLAVLQNACVKLKLPRPQKRLVKESRDLLSCFYLTRPLGFWDQRIDRRPPPELVQMVRTLRLHPELDIDRRSSRRVLGARASAREVLSPAAARRGLGAHQSHPQVFPGAAQRARHAH